MNNSIALQHKTGYLRKTDTRIFYQCWVPEGAHKIMVVAHGLGEHSGRYKNLVDFFYPKGYGIFALDHRGHGQSSGTRGHVDSFDQYGDDLNMLIKKICSETGQKKVILVGHSLGGLISVSYLLRYQETVSHLVLSSPGLRTKDPPPKIKAAAGKLLARIVPSLTMSNEIDPTHICHDEKVVQAYIDDPLVHNRVSTRFFVEFLKTSEKVFNMASSLTVPLLLLQAQDDLLVDTQASREFFEAAGSAEKEMKVYEGQYHEIFNEPEKEVVFSDLEAWLTALLQQSL